MRKLVVLLSFLVPSLVFAAGSNYPLDKAEYDLTDQASLQSGAQIFMNYCMGCHQAQYQRYQRTFEDIGVPLELGQQNLQFTGEKVGDYMKGAMPKASAEKWFGTAVPDLTLAARVRGADWLYTYLRTFYVDENRPFGVNNKVFPDVGMPHALQELQGVPYDSHEARLIDGEMQERYVGIKSDGSGTLSPEEYDQAVLDLVNFMVYLGEPSRLEAEGIGRWVIIFILVFFVFAYLLKKEYWRDVH